MPTRQAVIRPYANRIEIVDNSANILGLRWEFKM